MTNEQKQLLEMVPGDETKINGHHVMKSGCFWVIDGRYQHADLSLAAQAVGEIRCNCGNPNRPGHPSQGYCREAIGGMRL